MNIFKLLAEIKKRIDILKLNNSEIGSRVENGKYQLVNVKPAANGSEVTELSGWMLFDDFINYLDEYE